jgi:hypothetical protein
MKVVLAGVVFISLTSLPATYAVGAPAKSAPARATSALQQGLAAVMAGESNRGGQGKSQASNASARALQAVCSHTNPSASRSAVCRAASPS